MPATFSTSQLSSLAKAFRSVKKFLILEVFLLFIRLEFELELNGKIDIIQVVQNHFSSELLSELKSVGVKLLYLVWLHLLQMSHTIPDLTYLSYI